MKRLTAALVLIWHFLRALFLSAWTTSSTILRDSDAPNRGFATFEYGDLDEPGVMLLAALVTLTPGTSTLAIDMENQSLLLHILDMADLDEVFAELHHEFLDPISVLFGAAR
mgnify:CR=1 FL=1